MPNYQRIEELVPGSSQTYTFDLEKQQICADGKLLFDCHETLSDRCNQVHEFLEVSHELQEASGGQPLRLTPEHCLFVTRLPYPIPAIQLRDDDSVWHLDPITDRLLTSRIRSVRSVKARGLYGPMTPSTRLIVEGVAVSSLAVHSAAYAQTRLQRPWVSKYSESIIRGSLLPLRLYRCLPSALRQLKPWSGALHPYARVLMRLGEPVIWLLNALGGLDVNGTTLEEAA